MKPIESNENERQLSETLAAWRVPAQLPPRFQERVWQRLERRETLPVAGPWAQLLREIAAALARPRLAVSYVMILLALGLLAGFWQAQVAKARVAETLSAQYVQMLDPYQTPRH